MQAADNHEIRSSSVLQQEPFLLGVTIGVGTCLILGGPNYKIYKLSKNNSYTYSFTEDVLEHCKKIKSEAMA